MISSTQHSFLPSLTLFKVIWAHFGSTIDSGINKTAQQASTMSNEPTETIDPPTTLWAQLYFTCRHLTESSEVQCRIVFIAMEGRVRTQVQWDYEDRLKELETHLEIQHRGEMELLRQEVEKGFKILSVNLGCCRWWAEFWFSSSNFLDQHLFISFFCCVLQWASPAQPSTSIHWVLQWALPVRSSMEAEPWCPTFAGHKPLVDCLLPVFAVIRSFKSCRSVFHPFLISHSFFQSHDDPSPARFNVHAVVRH
jgi:hypothetical protein